MTSAHHDEPWWDLRAIYVLLLRSCGCGDGVELFQPRSASLVADQSRLAEERDRLARARAELEECERRMAALVAENQRLATTDTAPGPSVVPELQDALGINNTLQTYQFLEQYNTLQVLQSALSRPVARLQKLSREGKLELAFLQAIIYAALRLDNEGLLEEIAGEVRDGELSQRRAQQRVEEAATLVKRHWKAHYEELLEKSVGSLSPLPAPAKERIRVLRHASASFRRASSPMQVNPLSTSRPELARDQVITRALRNFQAASSGSVHAAASCVVFGAINLNLRATINGDWPKGDSSEMGEFQVSLGGNAANEAVATAKLGVYTYLVGRVASDENGNEALNLLAQLNPLQTGRLGDHHAYQRYPLNHSLVTQADAAVKTGVSVQLVFTNDSGAVKCTVRCAGANDHIEMGGEEVQSVRKLVGGASARTPELLLLQLELGEDPNVEVAQFAKNRKNCVVVLRASAFCVSGAVHAATRLLQSQLVDVLLLQEYARARRRPNARTATLRQAHKNTHTHTHAHAHARACTHAHAHAHTWWAPSAGRTGTSAPLLPSLIGYVGGVRV